MGLAKEASGAVEVLFYRKATWPNTHQAAERIRVEVYSVVLFNQKVPCA